MQGKTWLRDCETKAEAQAYKQQLVQLWLANNPGSAQNDNPFHIEENYHIGPAIPAPGGP